MLLDAPITKDYRPCKKNKSKSDDRTFLKNKLTGPFPYLNFTQSPHAITSRLKYDLDSGPAKLSRGSAFQIQPLFAKQSSSECSLLVILFIGRRVKYVSTTGFLKEIDFKKGIM